MAKGSYNQFCPVAMASEILCTRWTLILLRELVVGSTRFNDLRRGVPRMSPALLSKRLKDLETAGVVKRVAVKSEPGIYEYHLTRSGQGLKAVIEAVGVWGHRWIETSLSLKNLDVSFLMWDMRRNIDPTPIPKRRCVIQFIYPELPPTLRNWWLVVEPNKDVDLCSVDPGFNVDLYVTSDLRAMTAIWMGLMPLREAISDGKVTLTGDRQLGEDIKTWLKLGYFAKECNLVAA